MLLGQLGRRRTAGRDGRRARALRVEPRAGFRGVGGARFRGRVRGGPDSQPVREVQPAHQVRRAPRACPRRRSDPSRHRPLRPAGSAGEADHTAPRSGSQQGPGVRPPPARSGPARQRRIPAGERRVEGRRTGRSGVAGPGDRRETGIAGSLLHRLGHEVGTPPPACRPLRPGPDRRRRRRSGRRARGPAVLHRRAASRARRRSRPARCQAAVCDRVATRRQRGRGGSARRTSPLESRGGTRSSGSPAPLRLR